MAFTIGDLIVLLVVVAVLAVYRQLDRNNRSLEKVKRFVERVQAEMDEIVAEKVTMLKDIGIEVDVHQKAAKEVLKRIQAIEEDLGSRTGSLEQIGTRLTEYENALNELVGMTRRAEENIVRVRDESEYIDRVGKRIKSTQSKIEELERSLPSIVTGFEKQNNERLAHVEERLLNEGQARVEELVGRVDSAALRVQDFTEEVAALQTGVDEQIGEARRSLNDLHSDLESRLQTDGTELVDGALRRLSAARDEAVQAGQEALDQTEAARERLSESVDHFRSSAAAEQRAYTEQLESVYADYQQRLDGVAQRGEALETEALARLREHIAARVDGLRSEMLASVNDLRSRFETGRASVDAELERVHNELENWRGSMVQENERTVADIRGAFERNRGDLTTQLAALLQRVETFQDEFEQRLRERKAEMNDELTQVHSELTGRAESLANELYESEQRVRAEIEASAGRARSHADGEADRLEAELAERTGALRSEVDARIESVQQGTAATVVAINGRFEDLRRQVDDWTEKTRQYIVEIDQQMQSLQQAGREHERLNKEAFQRHVEETNERLQNQRADVESSLTRLSEQLDNAETTLGSRIEQSFAAAQASVESEQERLHARMAAAQAEVQGEIERLKQAVDAARQATNADIETVTLRSQSERERVEAEFTDQLNRLHAAFQTRHAELEALHQAGQARLATLAEEGEAHAAAIGKRIAGFVAEFSRKIDGSAQDVEQHVLGNLEIRLADYEKELNYRFAKIEAVNNDVDELEAGLRGVMERINERIRTDFNAFGERLHQSREADKQEAERAMDELRHGMSELEQGLNELKQRAYDNVSEKLKVFEDEFFKDLHRRSDSMDQRIEAWQAEIRALMETLREQFEQERTTVEATYDEELKRRLLQFQESMYGQLQKVEQQLDSFRVGLQSRMEGTEQSMSAFEESARDEIESLKERSVQTFRQEFNKHDERLRGDLKTFEEDVDRQIDAVRERVTLGQEQLKELVDVARSDVTVWQTQVVNQLRSSEAEVNNQLANFKVKTAETLHDLKSDYSRERDELIERSQADRRRITEDLDRLSKALAELDAALTERTTGALRDFEARYARLKEDGDGHRREVSAEIEERTGEFRAFVVDTREQFLSMQGKLLSKLDEEAKMLAVTLQEIDKRQKSFIEQTKIFERADALKTKLEESIEALKGELARVDASRNEVREIENQFTKIRKMSAEAGEKMARFVAEKRRIDLLEEDYKRLIGLSQSVESKLEQLNNSEDQLQEMSAQLRSLEELEGEVQSRFERLEKRRALIDQTVDGLERNASTVADMERRVAELQEGLEKLPQDVQSLTQQLKLLMQHRKEADGAVKQLNALERTLREIEERMTQLQTAREWLAGTETRLEQIHREATDQVKLLGSIMRDETKRDPQPGGAPSLSARETVQKLAHQGWNVDEIARATKVSKGEVELILELSSRK